MGGPVIHNELDDEGEPLEKVLLFGSLIVHVWADRVARSEYWMMTSTPNSGSPDVSSTSYQRLARPFTVSPIEFSNIDTVPYLPIFSAL